MIAPVIKYIWNGSGCQQQTDGNIFPPIDSLLTIDNLLTFLLHSHSACRKRNVSLNTHQNRETDPDEEHISSSLNTHHGRKTDPGEKHSNSSSESIGQALIPPCHRTHVVCVQYIRFQVVLFSLKNRKGSAHAYTRSRVAVNSHLRSCVLFVSYKHFS
jgi:hypothetical protein